VRLHGAHLFEVRARHVLDAFEGRRDAVDPVRLEAEERLAGIHFTRQVAKVQEVPARAVDQIKGDAAGPRPNVDERSMRSRNGPRRRPAWVPVSRRRGFGLRAPHPSPSAAQPQTLSAKSHTTAAATAGPSTAAPNTAVLAALASSAGSHGRRSGG
jgi:hypothetical protein